LQAERPEFLLAQQVGNGPALLSFCKQRIEAREFLIAQDALWPGIKIGAPLFQYLAQQQLQIQPRTVPAVGKLEGALQAVRDAAHWLRRRKARRADRSDAR